MEIGGKNCDSIVEIGQNERSRRPKDTCCHTNSCEILSTIAREKKLTRCIIIIIIRAFEIQTYHQISARRQDLVIVNKKKITCRIVDFDVPADHRVKLKVSEKTDKYLEDGSDGDTNSHWRARYSHQRVGTGTV